VHQCIQSEEEEEEEKEEEAKLHKSLLSRVFCSLAAFFWVGQISFRLNGYQFQLGEDENAHFELLNIVLYRFICPEVFYYHRFRKGDNKFVGKRRNARAITLKSRTKLRNGRQKRRRRRR
jgi:hypothetical protein